MSRVQFSLPDRQCLTWLHRVSCTHPQLLNPVPKPKAASGLWPCHTILLVSYLPQNPPTGGEATKAIYIPVMAFPKYFTKALAISSEQAIVACTTTQLLTPVWSRSIQAHGAGRPRKTWLNPQSSQSCGGTNQHCSEKGTPTKHPTEHLPLHSACGCGATLEHCTRTMIPPHIQRTHMSWQKHLADPQLGSLIPKVKISLQSCPSHIFLQGVWTSSFQ